MGICKNIKELFFPRWCCGCSKYGELLCARCFSKLEFNTDLHASSARTEHIFSISSLLSLEPISRAIIYQLKYKSVKELSILSARLMFLYGKVPDCDILTSIPLHIKRQNQRGFNQAEEIAKELARLLTKPYIPLLKRIKHTINLASISDLNLRKKMIADQFTLNEIATQNIIGKRILIIDDVWTTGATLEEAAKTLKQINPSQILCYTFAHGI